MTMPAAAIAFENVRKSYADGTRRQEVLRGASATIETGEFVAIVGPSGSGKSTLLHLVGGLDRRYEGIVRVAGNDVAKLSDEALSKFRADKVGFVFQAFNLLPGLDAISNVMLPGAFTEAPPDGAKRAEEALVQMGLADKLRRRPGELSGGERQRVAIARALYMRPSLLLCDEPTGNLDARTGEQIIELLAALHHNEHVTLVVVTHEERMSKVAGRVLRLLDGRLVPEVA